MFFKSFLFALMLVIMTGCGSNNSDTPAQSSSGGSGGSTSNNIEVNGTASLVFPSGNTATLTENSQAYTVDILVLGPDNAPADTGTVKIAYPDKIKSGVDVGYFNTNAVEVVNGHATFSYVGPQNLAERVAAGDTSTQFGFYLEDEPQNVALFTFNYSPAPNQIILTDYNLGWNKQVSETSMGLESSTMLSFYIENDKKEKIADSDITSMTVSLGNKIATLQDTLNRTGTTLSFSGKNNVSVTLNSKRVSGIVPIKVDATFTDANGDDRNISKVFNMTILSGPPTAISISYAGTDIDKNKAKFIERMIVTVTDKYFNNVNTQPAISAALIAGYVQDAGGSGRLYHTSTDPNSTATLDPTTNTLSVSGAVAVDLSDVDPDTDIAATFGSGYTYQASGKWDIASLNGTSIINLGDDFNASSAVSNLGYAIGNNYRQDTCRDSKEWTGYVKINNADGNVFTTEGYVEVDIYYDYYLTGKDVILAVNILGEDVNSGTITRIGEATKHTLRSTGLEGESLSIPVGTTDAIVTLQVSIANTGEWLRNANFDYLLTPSDEVQINSHHMVSTVGNCLNGGVAYVEANVTNTGTKAGTLSLGSLLIGNEF